MTWGELIRTLKKAGYEEYKPGKGSHLTLINRRTGSLLTVSVHTKKEVGTGLASKIMKEAGL